MDESLRRYALKIEKMCRFGDELAELGTDPRVRVGCVVFPVDCSAVVGIGYNGAASGLPHGSIAIGGAIGSGASGAAHAEANALVKAGRGHGPCVLYSSLTPCSYCAPLIVNSGYVVGVVAGGDATEVQNPGIGILQEAGLSVLPRAGILALARGDEDLGWKRTEAVLMWWRSIRPARPTFGGAT